MSGRAALDRTDPAGLAAAALFGAAVRAHDFLWAVGLRRAWRAPVPVISIGNLAVGGTGKTPAVIRLAEELRARGRRPAILSRGHGRRSAERIVLTPGVPSPSAWVAGDEPLEMFEALRTVPVIVAADRKGSARAAVARFGVDILLLDDGFQHRPLARDVDIVLLDADRPFGNGRLLPAGLLREPPAALARAGLILLTRAAAARDLEESRRRVAVVAPEAWIGTAEHRIVGLTGFDGEAIPLPAEPVLAVSGIARPEAFVAACRAAGLIVADHLEFPDHHRFDAADRDRVLARAGGRSIVTTAKDARRWRAVPGVGGHGWGVLAIRFEPESGFLERVLRRMDAA